MADMTNEEFKVKINGLKADEMPAGDDLQDILRKLRTIENFDNFDTEALDKLEAVMKGLELPPLLLDSLKTQIGERRNQIKTQIDSPTSDTPEVVIPEAVIPEVVIPEAVIPEADMPEEKHPAEDTPVVEDTPEQQELKSSSYDLFQKYAALKMTIEADPDNPENEKLIKQMKDIETYAETELSKVELAIQNAPIVQDYVEILTLRDSDYKYEKAEELEQKLAEYDKDYGLEGELPSAEEIEANAEKWKELTKDVQDKTPTELLETPYIARLKEIDPATVADITQILHTTALTQLTIEEPNADTEVAMKRYQEVITGISAQYLASIEEAAKKFPMSDNEEYLKKKFLHDFNISQEEFDAGMQDEEKKQHLEAALKEYTEAQKIAYNYNLNEYLKQNNLTREDWDKADENSPIRKGFVKYNLVNPVQLTNAVYTNANTVYAARVARKAGMPKTFDEAIKLQLDMTKKQPQMMAMAKSIAKSFAVAAVFGPIGLTVKQGWELHKDFKQAWKRFSEQTDAQDGKVSKWKLKNWKNFRNYLRENKEERLNLQQKATAFAVSLGASAAIIGMVGVTGGLGLAGGAVAGLTGATVTSASYATVAGIGVSKLKALANGVVAGGFGVARFLDAYKGARPIKTKLLDILSQQEGMDYTPEKKGLFTRFMGEKTPAQQTLDNLTKAIKKRDVKSVKEILLKLNEQDRMPVLQLAIQYQGIKSKARSSAISATLGAAGGLFVAEGGAEMVNDYARGLYGEIFGFDTNSGGSGTFDPDKNIGENLQDNQWKPEDITKQPDIKVPYAPGMQPDEAGLGSGGSVTLPADSFEKGGDMWYATQMGPTVLEEKLRAMGLAGDMDNLPRGSHGAIPSRVMADYLKSANLSPEQAQELQNFVHDREGFNTEVARINARDGYTPPSHHTHSHTGNHVVAEQPTEQMNLQQMKTAAPEEIHKELAQTPADQNAQVQKMEVVNGKSESGNWFKRMFSKKHDHAVVMPAGLNTNAQAEAYAGQVAMEEYNAKHPDAPITSPEEMRQHGYNVKGTVDGHKVHVKIAKGGDTETRTVDGLKTKIYGNKGATYSGKNHLSGNTVGDPTGTKPDEMVARVNENGKTTTYYKDGDTKKIIAVDQNNNQVQTPYSEHKVRVMVKNIGKGRS